jgi:large subunit ribosomal protein L21
MAETTAQKPVATKPPAVQKSGKKAVISSGGHQFIVSEGDELEVELLDPNLSQKETAFEALLVIDGDTVSVGTPTVSGARVTADILEQSVKGEKVVAIRYKAKRHTKIKIKKIS